MEEIRRSPVEVGCFSPLVTGFSIFEVVIAGFLNHQQYGKNLCPFKCVAGVVSGKFCWKKKEGLDKNSKGNQCREKDSSSERFSFTQEFV